MDFWTLRYIFGIAITCLITACSGGGGGDEGDSNNRPGNKQSFTVSTSVDGNGQIDPSTATILEGESAEFSIITPPGYIAEGITGCDGTLNGTTITVKSLSSDCTIHVTITDTGDHEAPTATILFPWTQSKTSEESIIVSGTASDEHEVESIIVNGIHAEIAGTSSPNNNLDAKYTYRWHARVPTNEIDGTKISVSTRDSLQNSNDVADSVALLFDRSKIPSQLAIASSDNEIFYITNSAPYSQTELMKFNFNTHTRKIHPTNIPGIFGNLNYDSNSKKLISVDIGVNPENQEYIATIYSIDIETGNSKVEKVYPIGVDGDNWAYIGDESVTFSERENAIYIIQPIGSYNSETPLTSRILKLPLGEAGLEVILNSSGNDDGIWPSAIEYTPHGFLLITDEGMGPNIGLRSLDGSSYARFIEHELSWPIRLSVNTDGNIAYLLSSESILQVAIPGGTEISTINLNSSDGSESLGDVTSTVLDETNDSLIISSHTYDVVKKINNKNGKVSTLISNGLGSGPELGYLYDIALDTDKNIAFTAQPGAPAKILKIDLNTGARSLFEEVPDPSSSNNYISLEGLVMDTKSQILYILATDRVLQKDIATGQLSTLTSNSTATGQSITNLTSAALDKGRNRLLTVDYPDSIVAVDLSTGTRTLVSKNGVKGAGINFDGALAIDVDPKRQIAFVSSQRIGALYEVDLTSGDRKFLTDTCLSPSGENYLGEENGMHNVRFNKLDGQIYTSSDFLVRIDPDSATCETSYISMFSDFDFTSEGQIIAISNNKINQLRFESSEQVIISK